MPEFLNLWKSIQEVVGKSLEIYPRNRYKIVGNLYQKSLETFWKVMQEIVGKSLDMYARNRWNIVGNQCQKSLEIHWKSIP